MRYVAIGGPSQPPQNVPLDFTDEQLGIDWGKLVKRLGRAAQAWGTYRTAREQEKAAERAAAAAAAAQAAAPGPMPTKDRVGLRTAGFGTLLPVLVIGGVVLFSLMRRR